MDNKRKKFINIEQLSSGEIYALLDGIESDEEDDIENLMNDSDTEFVAADETTISISDNTAENIVDDNVTIAVPEASIHILPEEPEEETSESEASAAVIDTEKRKRKSKVAPQKGKKKKTKTQVVWKWTDTAKPMKKNECKLSPEVIVNLDHSHTPLQIFNTVVGMKDLIDIIVTESNRYATQKGRNFETNEEEMMAFLGVNFIMAINKLPSIEDYWSTDQYIGNQNIQKVMTRTRFQTILQNMHFSDNDKDDKTDKSFKIRAIIEHLNKVFAESLSDSAFQSVDEHMCKFKGRSSMKQYIKNKPIKWGFKYWYRCDSNTGYVYQLELYLGRKESTELNLGSSVVLDLCKTLKDTYCHVFFDNFFNSPLLIKMLHDNGIYGLGTVRTNRKNMPDMRKDKEMSRGDFQCKYYNNIACIKWFDNKAVLLLGSHLEEVTTLSSVQRRLKGSASKIAVNCPNAIKMYNSKMGGVDLMDQLKSAYQLDRRSKTRFYLRLFFDLIDVGVVNSYIVYKTLGNNELSLKEFKICIASRLIGSFSSRTLSFPTYRASKRTTVAKPFPIPPSHLPLFLETRRRCVVCSEEGKENRTFTACSLCNLALCIQKDRNCFLKYHS